MIQRFRKEGSTIHRLEGFRAFGVFRVVPRRHWFSGTVTPHASCSCTMCAAHRDYRASFERKSPRR